jgi:hypothetical protein
MISPAFFLLAALAGAQPAIDETDGDRTPIRCRPAPFYVADRAERPKPERLTVTGSRVPLQQERRARPCLLMQTPAAPLLTGLRTAD